MLADMSSCTWVPFSSRVEPNMENWQDTNIQLLILTTSIARTLCGNFMSASSICDFLTQKWQCYCIVLAYFSYILYKTTWRNK